MSVIELKQSNFDETITNNEIVIIDFWAPWCGPCLQFAPTFKETSEKVQGVTFAKINTEEEQALGAHFRIRSIPTLMTVAPSATAATATPTPGVWSESPT